MISGAGSSLFLAAGPVHAATGTATPVAAFQGSGYVQPATGVTPPSVSCASTHPLPALIVLVFPSAVKINVGVGSVVMAPVSVYVGSRAT